MAPRKTSSALASAVPLSRLFSAGVLRELGDTGHSRTAAAIARDSSFPPSGEQNLAEYFGQAFHVLQRNLRSEYVFKNAIAEKILLGKHNIRTATMLTEFRAGTNKADVVILNGTSTAYEIKSERDTMSRIDEQISSYRKIFERVVVVTDECHMDEVLDRVPADVGLTILSGRYTLSERRAPMADLDRLDPGEMFESLQRSEYLEILDRLLGWRPQGIANGILHRKAKEAFQQIPVESVNPVFVEVLKRRGQQGCPVDFLEKVPQVLKGLALSTRLNPSQQQRVLLAMSAPAESCLQF